MQKVAFYDKLVTRAQTIVNFPFWKSLEEIEIDSNIITSREELNQRLYAGKYDVLIAFSDVFNLHEAEKIDPLFHEFTQLRTIIVGKDTSYEVVRYYFTHGVFDYLVSPVREDKLKETILKLYDNIGQNYVVNNLTLKADALIDNIFMGGGQESYIITSIFDQIYEDWNDDPVNCQIVSDKAKKYIYETLISRKPWLEKFLYKSDFYPKLGFALKSKEDLIRLWGINFREASAMVKKYQMIDDKLVYRIGKYAVVHVDEKLSLDDVSEGVYLNSCYISHIFKKVTGVTFVHFMTDVKIDRAKVLLRDENSRINEIAYTLGYESQEYFTKIFKKTTGVTPIEYKKMLQEKYKFMG